MITRTDSGLSNERLFYNVDAVVYLEGKSDLLYWQQLFSIFIPHRRFHFKPRGGKQALLPIAKMVALGTTTHVVVCLDRDHDVFSQSQITASNVIYTSGYSGKMTCGATLRSNT